jgi:ligand-binding sensor domain-containing protein
LPTQAINDIYVDSSSVMWLGSNLGLYRFDGHNYDYIELYSQADNANLHQIKRLTADKDGFLYLSFTNNGFGVLSPDGSFVHYKSKPGAGDNQLKSNAIDYVLDLGARVMLIFERVGIGFYDKKSRMFSSIAPSVALNSMGNLSEIDFLYRGVQDPEVPGNAWITGRAGMFYWDEKASKLSLYPLDKKFSGQPPSNAILSDNNGRLYLGGWGEGLHIFNTVSRTWERRIATASGVNLYMITCLAWKSDHELWLSTRDYGFYSLNLQNMSCKLELPLQKDLDKSSDMNYSTDNYIVKMVPLGYNSWCMLKHGRLGLAFLYEERQLFKKYQTGASMHSFVGGYDNTDFLITNQPFFFTRDRKTGQLAKIPIESFIGDAGFKEGFTDEKGTLHIIGWKGIYRYKKGDRIARHWQLPVLDRLVRSDRAIEAISGQYDQSGKIWLGTKRGIYTVSESSGRLVENWRKFGKSNDDMLTWFQDIHQTPDGSVWFAADQGVGRTRDNGLHYDYFGPDDFLNVGIGIADFSAIQHDDYGRLWLGGVSAGFGFFNWADTTIMNYTPFKSSDPGVETVLSEVSSLTRDVRGNIWGIFQDGLFRLDAQKLRLQTFGLEFGISEGAIFTLDTFPGGYLYAGSEGGYIVFHPDSVVNAAHLPKLSIWKASLLGMEEPDTLVNPEKLILDYPRNGIEIVLSVKPAWLATVFNFRYRMSGADTTAWAYIKGTNILSLWNLQPGKYTLEIQMADALGNYQDLATLYVPIEIRAAWWQTWWFRIVVSLLIIGATAFSWYRRQDKIKQELRVKKKLTELELANLRIQMNPHFIFNCLNTVKLQVIGGNPKVAEVYLDRFSRLMRRVLEYSSKDFIPLEDEIDFLREYVEMEQIRFKDSFEYEVDTPDEGLGWGFIQIPPMVLQPYVENAIRHGLLPLKNKNGKLTIAVQLEGERCTLVIRDNGIGRQAAAAFKSSGLPFSNSRGMQLSQDRLARMAALSLPDMNLEVLDLFDEHGRGAGTEVRISFSFED